MCCFVEGVAYFVAKKAIGAPDARAEWSKCVTEFGEKIRELLLSKDYNISALTELLLMFAARSELISKKINSLSCDYLLLDRFFDASLAYQGYGRNLPLSLIKDLNIRLGQDVNLQDYL